MSESAHDFETYQKSLTQYNSDIRFDLQDKNLPYINTIPVELLSKYPNPCDDIVNMVYDANGYIIVFLLIIVLFYYFFFVRLEFNRQQIMDKQCIILDKLISTMQEKQPLTLPVNNSENSMPQESPRGGTNNKKYPNRRR